MSRNQRQQEIKFFVNGAEAPISNAPELVFGNRTSRGVRRVGADGKVIKHRINKLQEGYEFQLTMDYDPDATGAAASLYNAISNNDGVTIKVCMSDLLTLPSGSTIAGSGNGLIYGISVLGDYLYFNYGGKIYRTHKYSGTPVGDVFLTFQGGNTNATGIHIISGLRMLCT